MRKVPSRNLFSCGLLGLLVLGLSGLLARSQTVVLHLKNGDRLTGTLVSETSTNVTLSSSALGKMIVPADQIARREKIAAPSPATAAPKPTNAPPAAASPAKPAPSKTTPETHKPPPAKPAAKPKPKISGWRKFAQRWHGEVQLGANLGYSTKDRQTYTGHAKATYIQGPVRNILEYDMTYGHTGGDLSDNRMDGSEKIEYDLSKRFLVYGSAGAGYDVIRNIDLQFDVGPGLGYRVITLSNFVFKVESGLNYQKQYYSHHANKSTETRYALRLAEDTWWQITPKFRFEQKVEFFPEMNRFGQYRVRGEANLSYALGPHLSFTLDVIDLYDTDVPKTVSNNDLQIRSLLGLKF